MLLKPAHTGLLVHASKAACSELYGEPMLFPGAFWSAKAV